MERWLHYSAIINDQIVKMFSDDNDEGYRQIDQKVFKSEDEIKAFIHALATTVPCRIFNAITGDDKNILEFNHIANILIFEFGKAKDESKETDDEEED